MKLRRRKSIEVPPKIRSFIRTVTGTPLENIEEPLKGFTWEFDKGDFHHWVDLFNHFDSFFEKHIKPRKDLQLEDSFLEPDSPFPREAVLQVLRVIRIILENCTNKHFYSSYEHHLSALLASTDADVVEACLQTLAAFLKKTIGKYILRDALLKSKLFALAQGWGGKEDGLGLVTCALQSCSDSIASELACTLHFEFYATDESPNELTSAKLPAQGLQIIHLPNINTRQESDLELLNALIVEYRVPPSLRFSLLTRLRYARAFCSPAAREQYTCIRLYAIIVLVQACSDIDDLNSFFNSEPEFINELVTLLSYEDTVSEKIRILSLLSLVALCQDRSRQPSVLTAVTSSGHRGILSSLMQKAVDSVVSHSSKWSVVFAETLLSLVSVLTSTSSGCSAMREAGFIPTLLPLLKDTDPHHLHLVSMAVNVLEAFMDFSNPAAVLFRDLGGLDDTISRLKLEVSQVEDGSKLQSANSDLENSEPSGSQVVTGTSSESDNSHVLYSDVLIAYHRRLLMKALLRAISLGTYAPRTTACIYGSEESLLPHCLCIIFKRAKDFGGGVFSLAATVMSDLIHKDPTCFPVLEAAGLPTAFIDAIMDGVICSGEAITCIPQCLDALCLNNNGLQAVKDRNALKCFVKIFTSKAYMRALTGDIPSSLSSGLDELMRHTSSLRGSGVEMVIEILTNITNIGLKPESVTSSNDAPSCSIPVPMETDTEDKSAAMLDDKDAHKDGSADVPELCSNSLSLETESFLPECISNVARLLETILQNSDTCRIFVERKGIEAVLQLFTLPCMPLPNSVGQTVSVAFKNFSPQHSASLARAVCSFLREHLTLTNDLLLSVGGTQLAQVEGATRTKVLRSLSSLEGLLSLSSFLLKGSTSVVSELGTADADILKDLGKAYREVQWQISLCCDSRMDEKKNVEVDPHSADASLSNVIGRESDDDTNASSIRYMNHVSIRNNSRSQWGADHDFLPVVRSSEFFNRRSRHGLACIRGRASRHLECLQADSEVAARVSETSAQEVKKKTPDVLVLEIIKKLVCSLRSFFTALVKGFTLGRRRTEHGSLHSASKSIGTALAKLFLEALGFSGYPNSAGPDLYLSVKCRYLGKVVDDMVSLTFDARRRTCYATLVNNFYVHGTFKELLTTFEATSQLLWTLPCSVPTSSAAAEKGDEESKLSHGSWLLDTLQSYCRMLEYFVNSSMLLSSSSTSQAQLLVQPIAVGLSIGLFPVPRDPEVFVRMLQSQVLNVILPIWNHPMFPTCGAGFVTSTIMLMTHICCGVGDVKRKYDGSSGTANQRSTVPPPDEATIATIVEMGFPRARAEEALRRVETNSVEMAMEWLFSRGEDPVQEDDELARALALSLGGSSETSKTESTEKSMDFLTEEGETKPPPVDDVLAATMKLFQSCNTLVFPLMDLLATLCNRNKGEDRAKVISYLIQQLKLCPFEFSKDTSALCMISHTIALILSEDVNAREIAAQNGVVSVVLDVLMNFKAKVEFGNELLIPKCLSAMLLILFNLSQTRPKFSGDGTEKTQGESLPGSSEGHTSSLVLEALMEKKSAAASQAYETGAGLERIFGKPTGYLEIEDSCQVLSLACDLIKKHAPPMVMQAALQLCARLTKVHALAMQFLEDGGIAALFGLPRRCFFPGYDTLVSAIIRHLLEDPQTLQMAMEMEIRQTLNGNRNAGRVSVKTFLTSMAPVICRDPDVFLKAAHTVCQLESLGGRSFVVLSKDKDKDKEKEKEKGRVSGAEFGGSSNECPRISENKALDESGKCFKGHKKVPVNFSQVIDHLLEIVSTFPADKGEENCLGINTMEVDEPTIKVKGKLKVDETQKVELDVVTEKSARLAKVTFVLKLLSDILLMYAHAVGVILRRDIKMCQHRESNSLENPPHGIIHHIVHQLLPLSVDKSAGPDEWRDKLSEKASWFLVVLSGRSNEGRRRVINELVKSLSSFLNWGNNSSSNTLLPDKKVLALVDLAYSILSKNSSSSSLPSSGCSPDIAKSMIDGGVVQCLSGILQAIDLDHPDAPKVVNLILKALESLTRAAYASEQLFRSDVLHKKKSSGMSDRSIDHMNTTSASQSADDAGNSRQDGVPDTGSGQQQPETQNNCDSNPNQLMEQEMRTEEEETSTANPTLDLGMGYMRDEMEDGGILSNTQQIGMPFHDENRVHDDMGEEDEEMGDDGEEEDDDDGDEEDEDIAEDGTGLMSLADTDVEDHDDTGFGDEYNDVVDEEEDEFHENRVIEIRWREALDGLDHLQVLGQPGTGGGLIDVANEPFEGVNVDDLFGLRRPFGIERRRQTTRNTFDQSTIEGAGLQHPLLSRPSHSSESIPLWSSVGNSSHNLEALSGGTFDVSRFYTFDSPVHSYDNAPSSVFGDRLSVGDRLSGTVPPFTDFSVGMESLLLSGRRGPGDGRWSDDGQPQAGGQASTVAEMVEEHFISQLNRAVLTNSPAEMVTRNTGLSESQQADVLVVGDSQHVLEGPNNDVSCGNDQHHENGDDISQPGEVQSCGGVNLEVIASQEGERPEAHDPAMNSMEVTEANGTGTELFEITPDLPSQSVSCQGDLSAPNMPPIDGGHEMPIAPDSQPDDNGLLISGEAVHDSIMHPTSLVQENSDIDMTGADTDGTLHPISSSENQEDPSSRQNVDEVQDSHQTNETNLHNEDPIANGIDPTFLEALPEDLRAEVLASQLAQPAQPPSHAPPTAEDIDPEFLAALPPDIQAEVLAQQRAQRIAQQAEGQPVDMDNASIIATFPADLREEVLLTSSEAVLNALPSPLLAEAQMLRDRAMSHYQARSLFGGNHRLNGRRNGLGFARQTVMDRGVGVSIGRRASTSLSQSLKLKELEGESLLDANALKALIRLLRLAQPLGKGLLQRLLLNLCAHGRTRGILVRLLLEAIMPETGSSTTNSQRLYGYHSNVICCRSQFTGLPPLVLRRILEIFTYLATNHTAVSDLLFYFDPLLAPECSDLKRSNNKKGKEKMVIGGDSSNSFISSNGDVPLVTFLKLLSQPVFTRSIAHLEQVMGLLRVIVYTAASKLDSHSHSEIVRPPAESSTGNEMESDNQKSPLDAKSLQDDHSACPERQVSDGHKSLNYHDIFMRIPHSDLHNLCTLLGDEGLSDKVYMLAGEVLKKLASVAAPHRKYFILELSELAKKLSTSAVTELITLRNTHMLGLSTGLVAGAAILRVLQTLCSLSSTSTRDNGDTTKDEEWDEHATMWKLNVALEPLWEELSECIGTMEADLAQSNFSSVMSNINIGEHINGPASVSRPLPPGTQRLLPFIEAFFVLCEKLQAKNSIMQQDLVHATAREVKESAGTSFPLPMKSSMDSLKRVDGATTFVRFAERHRRLLNAFVRQNPGLLEKSLSMMLRAPRLIDFDNKRAYFRSRIRQQHEQHLSGPLRIGVRRAYILEDSYNQLRMRPTQELKGRLNVHFQGEEGIDAGGLTREWYQLLSRVIFDKGALLFTTVGNNATFQPNPNSVYQTEHLSYFRFVGRVVAKALFDGQLMDVYFTRSFYKHILGVKVTYHDIEAVDPDYYKNLKWMLENDVSDIPDLTFSMDADEEKHILYEKTEVTDFELKPGGRNIRVTEETKHEYVDLVADHILTNAIRPQINSFLEGFNELIPGELISLFNDKELELLISGLPEIDLEDLKCNTEYSGYTVASNAVQWFWEVVKNFNKEDMARLLQFVTGTSKVPLEGFKALQGISGPQRFQIHKAYGAPERLPSAHTCFNQLDLPEYASKEQLRERLLLAIHEASEGFGFG
ncbi:E3 ubiquitin-protein ligase UPL1-like [Ipomoea triloba]|uniref:E3 ubiquitin-protein ligase UPL1-like n=1 Tax=Ipomoea triloba TaxID=35885 RepID=UPI00125D95DF|nr:E3 ubiquitin-protein ligase UPL1-like [Ipomoea triloba]